MAISSPLQSKVPTGSARTIKKLQSILLNRTKVKREVFQRQTILQNRREENERRKQREDELEAPNRVTRPRGPAQLIAGSAKGFFDRLIGFLGYLTAGWIVNNLPTWISMGKEFIARTQQMGKILGGFITNSTDIFKDFTRLLGATLSNLMTFDFLDTSGRVKTAFDELNLSVGNWGTDFEDAIKLLTTPLTEGIASGENARPLGTENTNEGAYKTGAPYSGSGSGENPKDLKSGAQLLMRKGFSEKGAAYLAGNIQQESGWNAMRKPWVLSDGAGTNKGLISWNRTRITAAEKFLGKPLETATASEQIDWIKEEMKQYGVLKTFQDKNATDEQLKKASYGYIVWGDLGARWKYSEVALQHLRKSGSESSQSQAPQQSTPTRIEQVPPGKINPIVGDRLGAGRNHGGTDLAVDNGTPLRAVSDGVIVDSDYEKGWGNFLVMKDNLGIYHLYGHMQSGYKRSGPVKRGEVIGKVGTTGRTTGPHLHWEAGTGWNGGVITGKFDPLNKYSKFAPFNTSYSESSPLSSQSPTPTPAQISPTGIPQNPQISQSLAQERTGPTVIVSQNPSSPAQQMMYSGGGGSSGGGSPQISEFALLNNFIKNKLLLDLAYL